MILEKLLESYPKTHNKTHRILDLKLSNLNLLYGPKGVGKTSIALDFYKNIQEDNRLYIDLEDCRINAKKDLENLKNLKIDYLIINNFTQDFPIPNFSNITLISPIPYSIPSFKSFFIPPMTFYEYKEIHKNDDALKDFIKCGNLLEINENQKVDFLKLFCEDKINFWILKTLILHSGKKVTSHQIFTKLKKEGKLSKDRFYSYCHFLENSKSLVWVEKFEHSFAPKKLYFWDFTLKNTLSFERNFHTLFENMVLLELLYSFKKEVFYTDKLDFYIPELSLGILCMPFFQPEFLEQTLNKIIKEREYCDRFLILSLNIKESGENLGMPYEILPFEDFVLSLKQDSF